VIGYEKINTPTVLTEKNVNKQNNRCVQVILSQKKLIEDLMFQPKVCKLGGGALVAPLTDLGRTKFITEKENFAIFFTDSCS
jgi:hypothetical protein